MTAEAAGQAELFAPLGGAFIEGDFRYHLWRSQAEGEKSLCLIMLNPSTADVTENDQTIRKVIGFASRLGFRAIDVLNLYGYRATNPIRLRIADFPVGARNDETIREVLTGPYVARVVVAWGIHAKRSRAKEVLQLIRDCGHAPEALAVTKGGFPAHPLYLPYTCKPKPFPAAA